MFKKKITIFHKSVLHNSTLVKLSKPLETKHFSERQKMDKSKQAKQRSMSKCCQRK